MFSILSYNFEEKICTGSTEEYGDIFKPMGKL